MKDIQKYEINLDRLKKIFEEFGITGNLSTTSMRAQGRFEGLRTHTAQSLDEKITAVARDKELPETYFSVFLQLQGDEFDAGYMYAPGFTSYVVLQNPSPQNIHELPCRVSENCPLPVVRVYEGDKFSIPSLTIFAAGKVSYATEPNGEHDYDPYFFDKQLLKRIKESRGERQVLNRRIKSMFEGE